MAPLSQSRYYLWTLGPKVGLFIRFRTLENRRGYGLGILNISSKAARALKPTPVEG